jgi:hypothetical protein
MTRSAVLFLVFNRIDTTKQVFQAIRKAKPTRLYIASDGARISKIGEDAKVLEVRKYILDNIDWHCDIKTLFRNDNLGCKLAPYSAITWFFEHEPEGIILEDDCLPAQSFFQFCDELLDRYRENEKIFCISGDGSGSANWTPEDSYWFSKYGLIWGWATWRRAWKHYNVDIRDSWIPNKRDLLEKWFPNSPKAKKYWEGIFNKVAKGNINAWDYQWEYACWLNNGIACLPKTNLISNLGFGADATHTLEEESVRSQIPLTDIKFPLTHPRSISVNLEAENNLEQLVFGIGKYSPIKNLFRRILRKLKLK